MTEYIARARGPGVARGRSVVAPAPRPEPPISRSAAHLAVFQSIGYNLCREIAGAKGLSRSSEAPPREAGG